MLGQADMKLYKKEQQKEERHIKGNFTLNSKVPMRGLRFPVSVLGVTLLTTGNCEAGIESIKGLISSSCSSPGPLVF